MKREKKTKPKLDVIKEKKHKINSKFLIILGIIIFISITIGVAIILHSKKTAKDNELKVSELSYVEPLTSANEAEAATIIKDNLVKITNKVNEDTTIIGTGFFIKEGYLITNSHVVDIFGDITTEYNDGTRVAAQLYANSIEYDIALLKVENIKAKALTFGDSNELKITNDVLAAGFIYNFAGEATISKGILSARRDVDVFTYLQSDISIDQGSSGGPLFNAKAEVVGLNTFVTENRTFSLSISSESVMMIVDALLENPTVEYLTEDRPKNSINKILVEVGYTQNENLDLYNDSEIINESINENEDKLEEIKKENEDSELLDKKEVYYCEDGFTLIGKTCIKKTSYEAKKNIEKCKEGYTQSGDECLKTITTDAKTKYYCSSSNLTLNSENKCIFEGYKTDYGFTDKIRYGSCPKNKKCYEYYPQSSGVNFIAKAICPTNTTTISASGVKYIWNGEELVSSNYKTFEKRLVYGKLKSVDSNGLTYYEDSTGLSLAVNCAKTSTIDEDGNKIYTFYTYDELKDVACQEGSLTASKNSDGTQGFYCKLDVNPSVFVYDVNCYDDDAEVWQEKTGSQVFCRKWVTQQYNPLSTKYCDSDYYLVGDTCNKTEQYTLNHTYYCNDNDMLDGEQCIKTITKKANKNK